MEEIDDLSLGLITYKNSKYLDANYEHKGFNTLSSLLKVRTEDIAIISTDKYSSSDINISTSKFFQELNFYLRNLISIQIQIVKYSYSILRFRPIYNMLLGLSSVAIILIKFFLGRLSKEYLGDYKKYVVRQKNISNNHIEILKLLSNRKSSYLLILEDDFVNEESNNTEVIVKAVIEQIRELEDIKIVNMSKSFTEEQLGMTKNRVRSNNLYEQTKYEFIHYSHPNLNTACAILYKNEVCEELVTELEKLNKYSFIPIDHKLNISLRELIKKNKISNTCYASVIPGIFIQRSLHA